MFATLATLTLGLAPTAPAADTTPAAIHRKELPAATANLRVRIAPAETLAVSVTGEGPVIVLLSGPIGSAYTWRHVIPVLAAAGYQVVTIDPLGMGRSGRPRGVNYTLEAQAERVRATLDTLHVDLAVIAAHGVSGSIAMRLALGHPSRVAALVSVEGGPAERAGSPGIKRALAFAPLLKLFGGRKLIRGKIRNGLRESSGDPSWVSEEVVNRYAEGPSTDVGATLSTLGAMADAREPQALGPRLGSLQPPLAFLFGGAPHAGGPREEEMVMLREAVPGAAFVRVEAAGHYLQEERPEEVSRVISDMAARVQR
ncbi:MAG: alpha/beta hydrolase [Gemmatimonadota bacterium]|nr:alpha/beta hydrolase [Gemmatimonadota bacterium]MDH4349436.1 alpha/beta hydrolase [Gemmatimonadota bacterium]MDH5282390.1 alpha/beta hydrolase [Gemmatimonadota bacterium]